MNFAGGDLTGADFTGADLTGANLEGADLTGADLTGANLYGLNLKWANLEGANLYGANLEGANLYGLNLSRADLKGANLYGADLRRANLEGAVGDEKTVWPEGFDSKARTTPTTRPTTTTQSSGLVAVDFWPFVDETTCVSRGTGVMKCLVGIGNYAGQPVDCLSVGVMGWRCIAYVPD